MQFQASQFEEIPGEAILGKSRKVNQAIPGKAISARQL